MALAVLLDESMASRDRYVCDSQIVIVASTYLNSVLLVEVKHVKSLCHIIVSACLVIVQHLNRFKNHIVALGFYDLQD